MPNYCNKKTNKFLASIGALTSKRRGQELSGTILIFDLATKSISDEVAITLLFFIHHIFGCIIAKREV